MLVPSLVGGVTTNQHIGAMVWTSGPAVVLALIGFTILGLLTPAEGAFEPALVQEELALHFNISLLNFLPLHQSPWAFIAATIVAGIGLGVFNMLIWAFITDVIDHQEVIASQRDDGVVYSMYSWARKVGQALAAGLGGWALGSVGYKAGTTQQAPETVQGIYTLSTLVPGVLYLAVCIVLAVWYPLSKKKVLQNTATLVERHAKSAEVLATESVQND